MNYYIPQWEERTSYGFRRIDPYGKLFEDRIIFLGTPISDDVANAVMAQLLCLESMNPDQDVQIYINSPGGSFTALTAIYDTMQFIKPDIQTVCLGQAASAAAVLLAAGTPGKRLALPNSRILIHQPYTEGTGGQISDLEIQANEIIRMRELLEKMIADASGKDQAVRSAATSSATRSSPPSRPSSTVWSTRSSTPARPHPSSPDPPARRPAAPPDVWQRSVWESPQIGADDVPSRGSPTAVPHQRQRTGASRAEPEDDRPWHVSVTEAIC